jgi:hypothetical protein
MRSNHPRRRMRVPDGMLPETWAMYYESLKCAKRTCLVEGQGTFVRDRAASGPLFQDRLAERQAVEGLCPGANHSKRHGQCHAKLDA